MKLHLQKWGCFFVLGGTIFQVAQEILFLSIIQRFGKPLYCFSTDSIFITPSSCWNMAITNQKHPAAKVAISIYLFEFIC
ncbi:hypothetical protein EGI22_01585 [Lacihabitans sp. LS3-19]|nr:hypothetical protein [Lacihabitans sp. LS3-19]